jgi:uracil-DNA glycosylase
LPRKEFLTDVASEVTACTKCPLWKTRRNAVPGEGSAKSKVMFVGEAPGRSEDAQGRPFVGAAGKFLDELLFQIRVSRENVFITNVVKCRPQETARRNPWRFKHARPIWTGRCESLNLNSLLRLETTPHLTSTRKSSCPLAV